MLNLVFKMLKFVFKMLKFVFKMLKLVLKTPKLLSPAISLQGLGWMSHQKKPANVRKKCIRVMWLENMFEFAVIENLERNFAVIFKICFGKK